MHQQWYSGQDPNPIALWKFENVSSVLNKRSPQYASHWEVPRQYFSYQDDDNDADAVRMTIIMVMMTIMMLMTTITIGDDDNYSGDDDGEVMVGR